MQQLTRWIYCFNGTFVDDRYQALEDYIASIRDFMRTQEVSPADMMKNIFPTLRGGARKFYMSLPINNMTLEEFWIQLRQRYDDRQGSVGNMLELASRQYNPKKHILKLIDELVFHMSNSPYMYIHRRWPIDHHS